MENNTDVDAAPVDAVVSQRWRVQAYDDKLREWYFVGQDSKTLQRAEWHRDHCLMPKQPRTKFRIIEESVIEKVVG